MGWTNAANSEQNRWKIVGSLVKRVSFVIVVWDKATPYNNAPRRRIVDKKDVERHIIPCSTTIKKEEVRAKLIVCGGRPVTKSSWLCQYQSRDRGA